jgi:hypothetical protein
MPLNPTYAEVRAAARGRLPNADARLPLVPIPLSAAWWPTGVSFEDQVHADLTAPRETPLLHEYHEEMTAIRDALDELGHSPKLQKWQATGRSTHEGLWRGLNREAVAHSLWRTLAMPIRRRGEVVHRVVSANVLGAPVVQSLPTDDYVHGVAIWTAQAAVNVATLAKSRANWRAAALLLGGILLAVLLR